jgi:hypothetical protein
VELNCTCHNVAVASPWMDLQRQNRQRSAQPALNRSVPVWAAVQRSLVPRSVVPLGVNRAVKESGS